MPVVPAAWFAAQWQLADPLNAGFSEAGSVAGLLMAVGYTGAIVALLGVPGVRNVLRGLFAPLGRMALTSYLTATVLMVAASPLRSVLGVPVEGEGAWQAVLLISAGILAAQWLASTLWLRHHAQGPLEALWRRLIWWGVPRG